MRQPDFFNQVLPVRNKLYRFALRILGSVEEAEDVVQEVLIKVWDRKQELAPLQNAEAWCMRVTKNLSLDRLKAHGTRYAAPLEAAEKISTGETPDLTTERRDLLAHIHQIIQQLPEKQRMIIQLRDIEGYTYKEIAAILELSVDQVKVSLFRARKTIKTQMERKEAYGR